MPELIPESQLKAHKAATKAARLGKVRKYRNKQGKLVKIKIKPIPLCQLHARWKKKKQHLEQLATNMRSLRYNLTRDLKSDDEKQRLTALAISLMDCTAERVGNDDSADSGHFGVTGFQKKHIAVIGNKVHLQYRGKSGVDHSKSFSDALIAKVMKQAIKAAPGPFVFTTSDRFRIRADKVNRYLSHYNITAKDIRGYCANMYVIERLKKEDEAMRAQDSANKQNISNTELQEKLQKKRKSTFNKAAKYAAGKVGHGPATLKNHYLMPELQRAYITDGTILSLTDFYSGGGSIKTTSKPKLGLPKATGNDAKPKAKKGKKIITTRHAQRSRTMAPTAAKPCACKHPGINKTKVVYKKGGKAASKITILYLHGLDAIPASDKVNDLNKKDVKIIAPQIDYKDKKIFDELSKLVEKEKPNGIIGHSMGGYVAHYLSNKYNIPALLFNPAFGLDSDNTPNIPSNAKELPVYGKQMVVIGKNDEAVSMESQLYPFKDTNVVIEIEDIGHDVPTDIKKKHFDHFIKYIHEHPSTIAHQPSSILLAPNGKPSNLNAVQYALVRTPEFKAWFGDWENDPANASKVVDENGEPLVVYHGTAKEFNVFSLKYATSQTKADWGHLGYFFTSSEKLATDFTRKKWSDEKSKQKEGAHIIKCFLNIKSPNIISARNFTLYGKHPKEIRKNELRDGYDGWIIEKFSKEDKESSERIWGQNNSMVKEFSSNQYVAFHSNQIKLADGSNTTFDTHSNDIRFEEGGKTENNASPILLAPNGKPSNLNAVQYALVRTPAFKAWFGDWENDPANASKVVDENGEPLVVYHGTNQEFEEFKYKPSKKRTKGTEIGWPKNAHVFTNNKELACAYSGVVTTANERNTIGWFCWPPDKFHGGNVIPVFLNFKNPLVVDAEDKMYYEMERPSIRSARKHGNDGIIIKNLSDAPGTAGSYRAFTHDEYITLKEDQIKSAIAGNINEYNKYEHGGHLPSNHNFAIFNNQTTTTDEISNIISGKSTVRHGATIQAAANYLRATAQAGEATQEQKQIKSEEAQRLKEYIDQSKLWHDDYVLENYVDEGFEQKVYKDNDRYLIKINDAVFYNTWIDYFNSLLLHNYFFPDTAYELIGFTKDDTDLYAVVKQPIISTTETTDIAHVQEALKANGFENIRNDDYYNPSLGITLEDLHDENVLTKDGLLYFIDTVFYLDDKIYSQHPAHYSLGGTTAINTGDVQWIKDSEGRKRFVINDTTSKLNDDFVYQVIEHVHKHGQGMQFSLKDILYHWDGYKYYPGTGQVKVVFYTASDDKNGYCPSPDEIAINVTKLYKHYETYQTHTRTHPEAYRKPGEIGKAKKLTQRVYVLQLFRRRLHHELQHVLQWLEGIEPAATTIKGVEEYARRKYGRQHDSLYEFKKFITAKHGINDYYTALYREYKTIPTEQECLEVEDALRQHDDRQNKSYAQGGPLPSSIYDLSYHLQRIYAKLWAAAHSNLISYACQLRDMLLAGHKFYNKAAHEKIAAAHGIKHSDVAKEWAEYAIVLASRKIIERQHAANVTLIEQGAKGAPARDEVYDELVNLYERQPLLIHRTSQSARLQQYSTPAPIAYLMGTWCQQHSAQARGNSQPTTETKETNVIPSKAEGNTPSTSSTETKYPYKKGDPVIFFGPGQTIIKTEINLPSTNADGLSQIWLTKKGYVAEKELLPAITGMRLVGSGAGSYKMFKGIGGKSEKKYEVEFADGKKFNSTHTDKHLAMVEAMRHRLYLAKDYPKTETSATRAAQYEHFKEIMGIKNIPDQPTIETKETTETTETFDPCAPAIANSYNYKLQTKNYHCFEPTAGTGLLTIALPPQQWVVNEIDKTRLDILRLQGFADVLHQDATQKFKFTSALGTCAASSPLGEGQMEGAAKSCSTKLFDIIITNPPFGNTGTAKYDNFTLSGLEQVISAQALQYLKDDGAAAIIIGGNTEYDSKGRIKSKKDLAFFNYLASHFNLIDVINISGTIYRRQGATYPIRIILISGRQSNNSTYYPLANFDADNTQLFSTKAVDNLATLYKRIQRK